MAKFKQIPESLLAKLWAERAARAIVFRSADGRRFRVIYPGRKGGGAGPDFRDAVLEEEGVGIIRGDVELHVGQKDWDAHGHGSDPRYNGVALHAVAAPEEELEPHTMLRSGQAAPAVSLEPLLDSGGKTRIKKGTSSHGDLWSILRSHGFTRPSNLVQIGRTLDRAGDARFVYKSLFFGSLMESDSPDQVVYAALMEALGYSRNRHPFFELAYNVTYEDLLRVASAAGPSERSDRLKQVLLREAGMFDGKATDLGSRYSWTLSGIRPSNHPAKRIAGFSRVLSGLMSMDGSSGEYDGRSLARTFIRLANTHEDSVTAIRALERALMGLTSVGAGKLEDPQEPAPIGRGRARDMVVNAVLPCLFALGRAADDRSLEQRSRTLFRLCPKLQENELTKEAWTALFERLRCVNGVDSHVRNQIVNGARRQQGLLHLRKLATSPNPTPYPSTPSQSPMRPSHNSLSPWRPLNNAGLALGGRFPGRGRGLATPWQDAPGHPLHALGGPVCAASAPSPGFRPSFQTN